MRFDSPLVVVLAGKDSDPEIFGGEVGGPSKFFMDFGGELVGRRMIQALDSVECRAIYVVGPGAYVSAHAFETVHPLRLLPEGKNRTDNIDRALKEAMARGEYRSGEHILLVMGDLPLLKAEAIQGFISACEGSAEADFYIGMIPMDTVDPALRETFKTEIIPYVDGVYLHSDVYLLRPDAITDVGKERFERILSIRRTDKKKISDLLETGTEIIRMAGARGVITFAKVIAGYYAHEIGSQLLTDWVSRGVEDEVTRIAERAFGPRISFVWINEPCLAYGFDFEWQLGVLSKYAGRSTG